MDAVVVGDAFPLFPVFAPLPGTNEFLLAFAWDVLKLLNGDDYKNVGWPRC